MLRACGFAHHQFRFDRDNWWAEFAAIAKDAAVDTEHGVVKGTAYTAKKGEKVSVHYTEEAGKKRSALHQTPVTKRRVAVSGANWRMQRRPAVQDQWKDYLDPRGRRRESSRARISSTSPTGSGCW